MKIQKIAVLGLKRIGDAVYTLPLIETLQEQLGAEIIVLTEPQVKDLYVGNPAISKIKVWPKKEFWSESLSYLKANSFDCCIVLHNAFKYALLPFLARIPIRVGYQKELRSFLLTDSISLPKNVIHRLEHNARLGDLVEVDSRLRLPKIHLTDQELRDESSLLTRYSLTSKNYIVFIVGSIAPSRRWFPKNFAAVATHLVAEQNLDVIILGGPEDYDIGEQVRDLVRPDCQSRVVNLAGKTSLRDTMRLFASSYCVVTNDTGPMHAASAMGVKVVTWFGAANEDEIAPPSPHTRLLNAKVSCGPCVKEICPMGTLECLHKITPEMVIKEVCRD